MTRKKYRFQRLTQAGFSHFEAIIAIIIIAGIGFVGARIYLFNSHAATGYVHVNGTQIYDANNNPIYLSGVDGGSWMTRGEGSTPDACGETYSGDPTQAASLKSMGYNTERIAISWANIEPTAPTVNADGSLTHHWDQAYLTELDQLIQADNNAGIMVILDMHQAEGFSPRFTAQYDCGGDGQPSWLYPNLAPAPKSSINTAWCEFFTNKKDASSVPELPQDGMAAAWQMLAARYNTNPTVIGADLFNEPHTSCNGSIVNMYEKMGAAVRVGSPRMILMYEDNAYDSYMAQGFELESKPSFTNAVYSWHLYSQCWAASSCTSPGQVPTQAHLARAQQWNEPLWIGETDAMGATRTSDLTSAETTELRPQMNYFLKNGLNSAGGNGVMNISWTLWGYDNGCCSVVKSGSTPKPLLLAFLQPYQYKYTISPQPTPTVTVASPAAGSTVTGKSVNVNATATVGSGATVSSVNLKVNGVSIGMCSNLTTSNASCSKVWDSTTVANGAYTIETDATASDGKSSSSTESVNVTNGLIVSITSPANNSSVSGLVPIYATASSDVVKSQVDWDGNVIRNVTTTSTDTYGWGASWNSVNAPNGQHRVTVTVWDAAGNSKSASIIVIVKN